MLNTSVQSENHNLPHCCSYYPFAFAKETRGEGNGTPLHYSCLENPIDGGAWKAAVQGVAEGRTRLRDFTFTFHFHALEKEMATHSSVLAWRIPGTGDPGWQPSMGVAQSRTRLKWLAAAAARRQGFLGVQLFLLMMTACSIKCGEFQKLSLL